jgi:hypothetical protein
MTPERRQQLMREAADDLRSRWGEVQPDAMQALVDDLRTQMVEGGSLSAKDIASALADLSTIQSLFTSSGVERDTAAAVDRQREIELER